MADAREWLRQVSFRYADDQKHRMHDALLAVVNLHQPYDGYDPAAVPGPWCYGCDEGYRLVEWPCVTVQDINKVLGIDDE